MTDFFVRHGRLLNDVHKIVGIALICVSALAFIATTAYSGRLFALGIGDGALTLMMWLMPAMSGYFAASRPKESDFGWTQGFWLLVHIGIICRMSLDLIFVISRHL